MILLDTNVVSELMRAHPEGRVLDWIDRQPASTLFTSSISQAEILYGIALLVEGRRRSALEQAAREVFDTVFRGRVLAFDSAAAAAFADIAARRRNEGRSIGLADAQIAGIAKSRSASVATRDVVDFQGCGTMVIDPWKANTA